MIDHNGTRLKARRGRTKNLGTCSMPGCERKAQSRDRCSTHYVPWRFDTHNWDYRGTISYTGAHYRLRGLWGSAKQYPCISCGEPASSWAYDGTDPEQLYGEARKDRWSYYSPWPEFYAPMCSRCHRGHDLQSVKEELHEYRTWKQITGLALADLPIGLRRQN